MKLAKIILVVWAGLLAAARLGAAECPPPMQPLATNPTTVIADYVLGCMISNGATPDDLRKCSCSIDFIAQPVPYDQYEKVETLMRLQQIPDGGVRVAFYESSNWAKNVSTHLREVQAESTLRCF